jgi:hypothetical protein
MFPSIDSKKSVSESILSINAIFPNEKVTFCCMKFYKRYLLMLLLAKSGRIYVIKIEQPSLPTKKLVHF